MSRYFSVLDLYNVIARNDIEGLHKAIFFLGVKIHVVKIWCDCTAMAYATELGHYELARVLLKDLDRYPIDWTSVIHQYLERVLTQRRPDLKCESRRQFHVQIMHRYNKLKLPYGTNIYYGESEACRLTRCLVKNESIDLLEILALENAAMYITHIVEHSAELGKRQLFQMSESIQNNPAFKSKIQLMTTSDPLLLAILRGKTKRVTKIIRILLAALNPGEKLIASYTSLTPALDYELRMKMFMCSVVQLDDVAMFRALMEPDMIQHTLAINEMKLPELLHDILTYAVEQEACGIISTILENDSKACKEENWLALYYSGVTRGNLKSTFLLKHLLDYDEAKQVDELCRTYERRVLDNVPCDTPVTELLEIVRAVERLLRHWPQTGITWWDAVVGFPMEYGRPDLVEAFKRYGPIGYTEADVLHKMGGSRRVPNLAILPSNCRRISALHRLSICEVFWGTSDTREAIVIDPATVVAPNPPREGPIKLIEFFKDCVVETGKRITPAHTTEPVSVIETERRASMNLQKLCRLSIREAIIQRITNHPDGLQRCDWESLTDNILSLYKSGHLPQFQANYLLYREDNVHRPLYYRLALAAIGDKP